MQINRRVIGLSLIVLSIALIALLSVVKADLDERDSVLCETFHANPDLDITQCPAHASNTSWYLTLSFGVAFLFLGLGGYLTFMPAIKLEITKDYKEVDLSRFDETEIKVYNLLKDNDGSMYQSDLIKETGLSKVKMTRLLDKLENKEIIDRKRRGMTNIIVLK